MRTEVVQTRVELDEAADVDLKRWARREGRSKRRHMSILIRKLTSLLKTHPDDLKRLGLLDAASAVG